MGTTAHPTPPGHGSWLMGLLRWQRAGWADDRELTHAIHGTVVGVAGMAAASLHGTLHEVVIAVLVTVFVYWAADRYARVLTVALHGPQRLEKIVTVLRHGWPMIEAAFTPLAVLIVVTLIGGNLTIGVLAALGVATVLLGGLGHLAARRAGASRTAALGWGAVSATFGIVVILLKLLLH